MPYQQKISRRALKRLLCARLGYVSTCVWQRNWYAGPLPQGVEALLVHSDNVEPPPVQLSLTAECPKVGLSLELAQDWPSRTSSSPDALFYHLEAAVKGISADLRPTGASLFWCQYHCHSTTACHAGCLIFHAYLCIQIPQDVLSEQPLFAAGTIIVALLLFLATTSSAAFLTPGRCPCTTVVPAPLVKP